MFLQACCFFLAIFDPQVLPAQTYSWIGTDGVFSSQFNWNPVGVPGAINPIEFNLTADIVVELTSNHSVRSIKQLGNRVTFVGGRQLSTQADSDALTNRLTFSGAGTAFQNSTTLNVGSSTLPRGEFWIRGNATAQTNDVIVAPGGLDAGRLVVVDPGSNLNNSSSLTIGGGGDGILFLNVGGMLTTGTSMVADQPLSASMAIIADNSRWETAGMLVFGNVGDADIYVEEGGIVTGGQTFIGRQNLSNSTVTVSGDGSLLQVEDLFLGTPDGPTDGGIGHLEILQLTATDATVVRVGGFNGEGSAKRLDVDRG